MAEEIKKSTKMLEVEKKYFGKTPLERALPEMVNRVGLTATAKELGLSKATLNYWMLKFGIRIRKVALAPGDDFEIKSSRR